MTEAGERRHHVVVMNPLPAALDHYQRALLEILVPHADVTVGDALSIEGQSRVGKIVRAFAVVAQRVTAKAPLGSTYLVLWSAFGYFDAMFWLPIARRARVFLVVHDVTPLRRQFGHSRFAHWAFRWSLRRSGMRAICHTDAAAAQLLALTGVYAAVLPLPLLSTADRPLSDGRVIVQVLGQFKQSRALEPLRVISESFATADVELKITGRGWPTVEGWVVDNRFVEEDEFDALVAAASCVVIPYANFYQSDVAVRCLEGLRAIVAPRHPQIDALYGTEWAGTVINDDWAGAVHRVTSREWTEELRARRSTVAKDAAESWVRSLELDTLAKR